MIITEVFENLQLGITRRPKQADKDKTIQRLADKAINACPLLGLKDPSI